MQNCFRCTSARIGNCATKRADMHIDNKNIFLKIYRVINQDCNKLNYTQIYTKNEQNNRLVKKEKS